MAEIVTSAVVQESFSQILSGLVQRYEEKAESNANINLERLEMAHIRLEAALETSYKWQITDAALLRWRRKLKFVARECKDTLHNGTKRILGHKQKEQEVSESSLPSRIAHATKSFVISMFNGQNNELSNSIVQRFEWFAAGASEFLRLVELGGTPRRHIPFQSLVSKLSAGMELHLKIQQGNQYPLFELWLMPNNTAEHGIVANMFLIEKCGNGLEGTTYFSTILQLSETTDIVGIALKCLHLFAPHLKCSIENIRRELTLLHTQNFFWLPPAYSSSQKEHWNNLSSLLSQWLRPNSLCCQHCDRHALRCISNSDIVGLSDVSLEPVIEMTFQIFMSNENISLQDAPYLKAGITFAPHGSLEGILPANSSSAIVAMVGEKQYCLHRNITLEQLKEIMLPKAVDYFCKNPDAAVYQMIWKSKHGSALIHFGKPSMSTYGTYGGSRKRKLLQGQDQGLSWAHIISRLLDLWGAQMPVRLRTFFMDWMQKEKQGQFTAQQGHPYHVIWTIREQGRNLRQEMKCF